MFDESVHAYPKPLRQRGQVNGEATALRWTAGDVVLEPMRVGLVVVTSYVPGGHWQPEPISMAQAVLALLDNTVVVRRQPELALSTLTRAATDAVAISSVRGQAQELADELLQSRRG